MSTCKRGHVGAKRDSRGTCMECQNERNRQPSVRMQQRLIHKRHPKPEALPTSEIVVARLAEKSVPVTESGCWIWIGSTYRLGYGQICIGHHRYAAHRVSYANHIGPVPADLMVCHKCDTPECINPTHLFLGSPADNAHDMCRKGRHANQNYRAKDHR